MRQYDRRDIEQLKGDEKVKEEYISVKKILVGVVFVLAIVLLMQV